MPKALPQPPNAIIASIIININLLSIPEVEQEANKINKSNRSRKEFSPG